MNCYVCELAAVLVRPWARVFGVRGVVTRVITTTAEKLPGVQKIYKSIIVFFSYVPCYWWTEDTK